MTNPPDSKHIDEKKSLGGDRGDAVGTRAANKKADRVKVKDWPGYVRAGVYVIEKKINGKKFHRSTHCTSLRAALKQLERFEANPSSYNAAGDTPADALVLDEKMIDAFHEWHLPTVTKEWAGDVRRSLIHWANHLRGADLRSLSLIDNLKPYLRTGPSKPLRTAAIKLLFRWLRTERGLVTRVQDVTLDLITPAFKPRQETGESKAIEYERLLAVVPYLKQDVRDVLDLLAVNGWHVAELRRFAQPKLGVLRPRDAADKPEVLATMGTTHKDRGKWHFTALLFQPHVEAAQRIRARGKILTNGNLAKNLKRACAKAGVKRFNMGDMRASVLTWLRIAGVPPESAMAYVGHTDPRTQEKFYVKAEATKTVLPRSTFEIIQGGKTG